MTRNNDEQARKDGEKLLQIMEGDRKRQETLEHIYEIARAVLVETRKPICIVIQKARKHTDVVLVDVCVWTDEGPERVIKQAVRSSNLEQFIDNSVAMATEY